MQCSNFHFYEEKKFENVDKVILLVTQCVIVLKSEFISDSDDLFDEVLPVDLLPLDHCRYVCELDLIAQQLKHCTTCSINLHLYNSLGVRPYGVTGIVYVKCHICESVNRIRLGKTHHSTEHKRGLGTFDVNTKLATGMLHVGIGETQINNLFSTMNVHYPHHKTLKSRENEVGIVMETQATNSEQKFLLDEAFQSMTIGAEENENTGTDTGLKLSTDTCWQKKGSGRSYDSLSEVLKLKELAGDDDSTGFNRAAKLLPHSNIVKSSDRNHIMVNASKKLYSIKLKHKELSAMVINSFLKNYSFMLSQNQGNSEGIENGVRCTIDHMYGQHTKCDVKWCGYLKRSTTYRHSNLPYGKNLSSLALKNDLERLFLKDIEQRNQKIIQFGSSQSNESFNFTLSTKAPKYKHNSGSSSLGYGVSASVLQKNEGYRYISEVNESAGLSPGNMSIKRATLLDKRRATKLQKSRTRKFKTERKRLKEMKLAKNSGLEIREGKTYESEIGMTEQNVDEIEIPDPPEITEFTDNILTAPILIFDLETTGLQRTSDIIQIAAYSQNNKFSSYIMPNRVISNGASAVTNISVIGSQMYYNLQPVPSKLQNVAFTDFNDFVKMAFWTRWNSLNCYIQKGHLIVKQLWWVNSLGETYSAHNAEDDTEALYRLVQSKGDIKCNIQALVFSANYPKEFSHQQDNLQTFTDAIFSKAISRTLALKAARSNLRLEHFNIAVKRNGLDGLKSVLSEQTNQGIVRVTTNKKAIIKIFDFLTRES
ncbi:unnamed protein product [Mytilus edulis]|uniref:Exonuclease domain-containing protein n=1 Tax=Mytilus edulis TaxID=6550 RepID=A0A8S3UJN2_MYTED|nr:unnamed protein product [Mytilus edulis]